jgi:DNA polymerase (family 10)
LAVKPAEKYNTIMDNSEIAEVFKRIAALMEIKGEDWFKISAYQRAAESIQNISANLSQLSEKELMAIPGIGKAIAGKIMELNSSGRLGFLEKLEAEVPPTLIDLLAIQDVGPKKVARFWHELGVTTIDELDAAARSGKIRNLPGMREKSETRILEGIQNLKNGQ